jgi:DNA-binding CsgD family transcriptional regulator
LPTILLDEEGVAHLRQAGLVAGSDVSTVVRRLDAMVLLDDVPPDELSARRRALGGRLRAWAGWQARADLLTLRGGGTVPTHQLVQSVDRSLADGRVTDAGELLHALPPMDDPAVLLLQGRVCSELGRLDEALAHLQAVLATAQADSVLGCVGRELGLLLAVRRMDPGAAVASVEGVLSRMVDPGERRVLAADLVKWRLMAGQPVDRGEPDEGDARAVVMARTRLTESLIGAMLAALDGTRSAVQDHVDAGFALLADVPDVEPWVAELLTLSQYLGLAFDGDVDTAEALAAQHRDRAASAAAPSLGMWEYAAAETALHRGVTRQAAALARRAVRHLAWRDYTGLRPTAAALVAAVDARCGRLTSAERQVDQIPAALLLDVKVELHVARVRAERRLRERDVPGAAQILDDVGRRAAASAHRHLGVMAVDEAMMIDPRESRRELLVELIGDSGSELGDALAGRAAALTRGGPGDLVPWVDRLLELGMVGRAAHAASVSSRRLAAAGEAESARRWRRRAIMLGSDRGAASWPVVEGVGSLTQRELDIARLAAERARSREIAEQLGLSVRTIDNHLARVYRKLGVSGRDELREALV